MKLIIPGELPTMNEIVKVSKSHPMAYANMKKKYTGLVVLQARKLKRVDRADFHITWHCKDKRKDKDNISGGGTKFLLDGLVAAGVIDNDGWKQVGDITNKFAVDKENPRIEVEITPIQEG